MNIEFTIDQFFEIIDFYNGNPTNMEPMLQSIARNELIKVEQYFEEKIDQKIHMTPDWVNIRLFTMHWYAAFRTLNYFYKNISDINYINKVYLLESFGYFFHYLNDDSTQQFLAYNLNRLYAYKGTPETIITILESANIVDYKIFEYWLINRNGELLFEPRAALPWQQLNLHELSSYSFTYDQITNPDPHWYYTAQEILDLDATELFNLPSMTPYFGLVKIVNWVRDTREALCKVKRTIREQLIILNDTGSLPGELFYPPTNQTLSLTEIYCAFIMAYHTFYALPLDVEKNADDVVSEVQLPQEIVYDNAVYIDEFDHHYSRYTYDKVDREETLSARLTDWNIQDYPFKTAQDYINVLEAVNPALFLYVQTKLNEGDFQLLVKLMEYLEFYIGLYWDISVPLHYMIYQDNISSDILSLIDFFKPYPSRLIIFDTVFVIDDLPGDIMVIEETTPPEEIIQQIDDHVFGFGYFIDENGIDFPYGSGLDPVDHRPWPSPYSEPETGNHWMFDFHVREVINQEVELYFDDRYNFKDHDLYNTIDIFDITARDIANIEIHQDIKDSGIWGNVPVLDFDGIGIKKYVSENEEFEIQIIEL